MQTEMRTSMQREAVAHLTAMDITMKCHYKMSRPNVQKILYKNVQLVCLS